MTFEKGNAIRHGDVTWDDLSVPLSSINTGGVNAPDFLQWRDDGSGSVGVYAYAFSHTAEEEVFFEAQLPHGYVEGTEIEPHIHAILTSDADAGETVRFGLEYTWSNVNDVFPATTIIYADRTLTDEDVANKQLIIGFEPDIEEAGMRISAMLSCRLFRDVATDTYAHDVVVLELDFHYRADERGSEQTFIK